MPQSSCFLEPHLIAAEEKAALLFETVETRGLIRPGCTEKEINDAIYALAFELFGIRKYWHKRIVRSGPNTLLPYRHNPENLTVQEDDIVFLDFGPVFEEWEADYGRTYVLGSDPVKHALNRDLECAFQAAVEFYRKADPLLTGSEFYHFICQWAAEKGWLYGGPHAGHLIGKFPHEKIVGDEITHYIHPENHQPMRALDALGGKRRWILEIHFITPDKKFGGFFEQLL